MVEPSLKNDHTPVSLVIPISKKDNTVQLKDAIRTRTSSRLKLIPRINYKNISTATVSFVLLQHIHNYNDNKKLSTFNPTVSNFFTSTDNKYLSSIHVSQALNNNLRTD